MSPYAFLFFFTFLAQTVHGLANDFRVGEETIKIPTPAGLKRIDQLKDLAKAMSIGGGYTLMAAFGFLEDYARLSGGHFPAIREAYFTARVARDADWTTVTQKGFDVYKAFVHQSSDKNYWPPLDASERRNNEEALIKLRKIYPSARYDFLLDTIRLDLEESSSSMLSASVYGPLPATSYIAAHGPSCEVTATSLISGKIIIQTNESASYISPEDLVKAVDALRVWRNNTVAANNNYMLPIGTKRFSKISRQCESILSVTEKHAEVGIQIRVYGKRGQINLSVSPSYVQGYLIKKTTLQSTAATEID
jgi:hypothetical protein